MVLKNGLCFPRINLIIKNEFVNIIEIVCLKTKKKNYKQTRIVNYNKNNHIT